VNESANAHLTADLARLPASGEALVVGAGGAESSWLAECGWEVTTVDPAVTDMTTWTPDPGRYLLVASLNVPIAGSAEDFVVLLASAVDPDGTLYIVGHLAPGQNQTSSDDAIAALSDEPWEIHIAEERERPEGDGFDAIFYAENSGSF
jgi:hypothetical protein